jgi:hypothetical protein
VIRATDIYRKCLIVILLAFVLSYNFHQLWLIYDLFIVVFGVKMFLDGVYAKVKNLRWILAFLIFMLALSVVGVGQSKLIGWLSFWDTFKHVLFIISLDYYVIVRDSKVQRKLIDMLVPISAVLFIIQFVFVYVQHMQGRHVDDVAGTFGDGSSHSIAYFSLFVMVFAMASRWTIWKIVCLAIVCSVMNYWSENIGFFLILLLIIYYYTSVYRQVRLIMLAASTLTVFFFLFSGDLGDEFDEYQRRIQGFFHYDTFVLSDDLSSDRSTLTAYAFYEGGIWGKGAGYFSEIYSQSGEGVGKVFSKQINISEISHLIAEYGVIGTILTIAVFILIFVEVRRIFRRSEWVIAAFVVLTFLYNRILMDERIVFFTILSIMIIRLDQRKLFISQ